MTMFPQFDPNVPVQYRALLNAYRHKLRVGPPRKSAAEIPPGADDALLEVKKSSHEGLAAHAQLKGLGVTGCTQNCLEEIGQLAALESLDLRFPTRITDLAPLAGLPRLRVLRIESAGQISDFTPLLDLPALEVLQFEQCKQLFDLSWITPLKDRLKVLGLEGSISTDQKIASFEPLTGFALEALFTLSCTLKDKSLAPLATCPDLYVFDTARLAPKKEFQALEAAKPDLVCNWFDWAIWK